MTVKKTVGVDHLTIRGVWVILKKHILEAMHTCTKKNHARAHCRKNPRTFSEPKKEHITSIHVARKKQIPSPWKGLKNHLHTPPQKSKGPSLSDGEQMHSSPRWIFFHAQRVVKTKRNSESKTKPLKTCHTFTDVCSGQIKYKFNTL